jgi:diguanylate cyclase (GGDEF)-like protein
MGRAARRRGTDADAPVLSRRYVDALRVARTTDAEQVVDDALAAGLTPPAIQSLVIEPAMTRIGLLWEANAITVADEHLATAVSQAVLVTLFDRLWVARPRSRERVLLAAVEGQHHVLGLRMVADVMEGAGFDVLYLGADVPVEVLRRCTAEHRPAIAGLGFAVSVGVGILADSIHAVHEACPATRVMLGGRAVPPGLVEAGYMRVDNSMEVLFAAERLLRETPRIPDPALLALLRPALREPRHGREAAFASDAVAERMAQVTDDATAMARDYVRLAGTFRDLACRDPVTDLGNRRAFDDRMQARRPAAAAADGVLLMIDVDGLKAVNDAHGRDAGDVLLRRVGALAVGALRSHDFVARVGGDEFAVLLERVTGDQARAVAARIAQAIADDPDLPVTVSIGLAPLQESTRATVLAADVALHQAKAAGRSGVRDAAGKDGSPAGATTAAVARMYVSMSRLEISPERAPQLVEAFRRRAHLADEADGFIDLQVWQSDRDLGDILMVSRWRDRSAFTAYMKSAAHRISHERIDPDLKQDISLKRLDHLHTYEVVAE